MNTLLFDIETSGIDFETLDEAQKDYLMRPAERGRFRLVFHGGVTHGFDA